MSATEQTQQRGFKRNLRGSKMRNVVTIAARDREVLFRNTAAKMGMSEAIIEKGETDFPIERRLR